jgi:hypothetical protein
MDAIPRGQRISSGLLMNTFPKAAPFEAKQNGHKLFWFTVGLPAPGWPATVQTQSQCRG